MMESLAISRHVSLYGIKFDSRAISKWKCGSSNGFQASHPQWLLSHIKSVTQVYNGLYWCYSPKQAKSMLSSRAIKALCAETHCKVWVDSLSLHSELFRSTFLRWINFSKSPESIFQMWPTERVKEVEKNRITLRGVRI